MAKEKLDPRGPNKFEPTTKAKPYGGAGQKGSPDHGSPGENKKGKK